jgi:flagellar biosynthesis/type III secretory pathway protein FliH
MITASHLFEDFGGIPKPKSTAPSFRIEEVEDQKLESFENGYRAGWDDAIKAQAETNTHVSSELATSLQDASFEFHEVRNTLSAAVQDIMDEVMKTIMPKIAQTSLGAHIREQVISMTRGALDRSIEIVIAPDAEDVVRTLFDNDVERPFRFAIDPLLSPTQVLLRVGAEEREINLHETLDEVSRTVQSYFETEQAERKDG